MTAKNWPEIPPPHLPDDIKDTPPEDSPPGGNRFGGAQRPPADDCGPEVDQPAGNSPLKLDELVQLEAVRNHRSTRSLREKYASKAYSLACGCISFWIISIGCVGIINAATQRQILSDTVMIAITTGSTINVLAAFLGVIRGLFPSSALASDDKK